MTAGPTFDLDGVPCVVDREPHRWTLVLRRSLAPVRDIAELDLLTHAHDALLPCEITHDDDSVTLHLTPPGGIVDWDEVRRMPRASRLRALMNVGACADLVDRGYAVLLHPGNLVVDRNLRPLLAYRGLAGVMPPRHDPEHVLRQYQALVLSTMDPKASYPDLLGGELTLRRASEFERSVIAATSVHQLAGYLTEVYDGTVADDAVRLVRVGRRSHAVAKHSAIWLGVAAAAAGALAITSAFVTAPFQERMLQADQRFVALDYDGVIETLRPVAEERLPLTQRYELAYAFLRGTNLSDAQRTAIENNLTLSSDRNYLTYWVQTGRGDLEDALDTAKKLDDVDLVLYALTLLQEQARVGTGLDGAEREAKLEELQTEYDKYFAARSGALDPDPAEGTEPEPTAVADPQAEDGAPADDTAAQP